MNYADGAFLNLQDWGIAITSIEAVRFIPESSAKNLVRSEKMLPSGRYDSWKLHVHILLKSGREIKVSIPCGTGTTPRTSESIPAFLRIIELEIRAAIQLPSDAIG